MSLTNKLSSFRGFEACHVWDMPQDPNYYDSVANLVLVPRGLAQLTDHCDAVKEMLRYEVYKRFQFCPAGLPKPMQPIYYSQLIWI